MPDDHDPSKLSGSDQDALFSSLADDLRRIAALSMRNLGSNSIQPTQLVNEVYLKWRNGAPKTWNDQAHFMALAACTMRSILVDHVRRKRTAPRVHLDGADAMDALVEAVSRSGNFDLDGLGAALEELERRDATMARFVDLRFFGGLTLEEAAQVLGIAKRTLERKWDAVRHWIQAYIEKWRGGPER